MLELNFEDRKVFTTETLSNGMQLHFRPDPRAPKQRIRFIIFWGHLHNHHFANGATHFFEHVTLNRSEKYKDQTGGLAKKLEFEGGSLNACTGSRTMVFEANTPLSKVNELQKDFVHQIFYPLLFEEDISIERGAIRTEKWSQGKYYPWGIKEEYRFYTEWVTEYPLLTPEFVFGSDEDIRSMSVETLKEVQAYFFSPSVQIVVNGGEEIHSLREELAQLPTSSHKNLDHQQVTKKWANKPLTELPSSIHSSHALVWGGILPQTLTPNLSITLDLLEDILSTDAESILFREYREKQKILYTPQAGFECEDEGVFFWVNLSFADDSYISQVSQELEKVIFRYLNDTQYFKRMGQKKINDFCVNVAEDNKEQTDSAVKDIRTFGRIIPMTEQLEHIQDIIENPQNLLDVLHSMETHTLHVKPEES